MLKNRLFVCLMSALSAISLHAQNSDWMTKVDPRLLDRIEAEGKAECLIILSTQADLSPTEFMRTQEEKGAFVYETLVQMAESTQEPVRLLLRGTEVPYQSFWVINALWTVADMQLLEHLAQLPEVARIEDNPVWSVEKRPEFQPSGPVDRSLSPWGLTKINAPAVWAMGYEGQGVVVGGQDTGYEWQHPAIKQKYRGWNGSTADHNYNWHDAIHSLINGGTNSCGLNLTAPCDDNNHGTHTVGTMCGGTSADSTIGVAPEAKWMGCRDMEEGDGTPATYIECFQWFIAPTNLNNQAPNTNMAPNVINNSWGCPTSEGCNSGNFATMETVVNNVRAAGILVVVSAGNSGPSCSTVNTPAAIYGSSFSVGATNSADAIASFSSRGPVTVYTNIMKPNISAPGVDVASCIGNSNNPGTYSYANWAGTSMAGPHVAGLAALIMSARPDLKGNVNALEDIIENTAVELLPSALCGTDTWTSSPNNIFGHGRINALAAVTAALALPVEFLSFTVKEADQIPVLEWRTTATTECARFEVERSADGLRWEQIGLLPCQDNAATEHVYEFPDKSPMPGLNYYRLRQVDWAGPAVYSKSVVWNNKSGALAFQLVPHRADQSVLVSMSGEVPTERYELVLLGSDGREIGVFPVADRALIALPEMPAGLYAAWLRDGSGRVLQVTKMAWW